MPSSGQDGYERISEPPHLYLLRPEWKAFLLPPLRDDFSGVRPEDRTVHHDGRIEHFAYQPPGAPGRVLVRRAIRASIASLLGDLHLGLRHFHREIRLTAAARRAGVNVPEIVAARLTRVAPLFYRYLLVVLEIPGASNLYRFLRAATPPEKIRLIRSLSRAVRRMHESGIYHGDLTLRNILVSPGPDGLQLHFIDLDRGSTFPGRRERHDVSNLSRMNRFVEKWLIPSGGITNTDKWRFLLSYCDGRNRAARLARSCGTGLWLHRLWWRLFGPRLP